MKRLFTLFFASLVLLGAFGTVVLADPYNTAVPTVTSGPNVFPTGPTHPPNIDWGPREPENSTGVQPPKLGARGIPIFPLVRVSPKLTLPPPPQIRLPHIIGKVEDYQREHSMMVGFSPGREREVRAAVEALGVVVNTSSQLGFILCTWDNGVDMNRVLGVISQQGQTIRYCVPNYKRTRSADENQDADQPVESDQPTEPEQPAEADQPDDTDKTPWGLEMIHAQEAWYRSQGENIVVAVLDTGVDYRHPDLASRMYEHTGTLPSTGEKRDGVVGVNFCADGKEPNTSQADPKALELVMSFDPSPLKQRDGQLDAHGTHVAGTIAAAGAGTGVVGVAPRCKVMPLQIFYETQDEDGNAVLLAPDSAIIFAIDYAVRHGAKIINLSLSNDITQDMLKEYLKAGPFHDVLSFAKQQGVLLVLAAGNKAAGAAKPRDVDVDPTLLASFTTHFPNMLAVAAIDSTGELAPFSYTGKRAVSIAAPGTDIRSTLPEGKYGTRSGTSMAAPHVAGAAALILAACPTMTPEQVIAALVKNGLTEQALLDRVGNGKRLDLDFIATLQCVGTQKQPGNASTAPSSGYDYNPSSGYDAGYGHSHSSEYSYNPLVPCDCSSYLDGGQSYEVVPYQYGYSPPIYRRPLRRYAVPVYVH